MDKALLAFGFFLIACERHTGLGGADKELFDCHPEVVQNRTKEDQERRDADYVIREAMQAKANCQ